MNDNCLFDWKKICDDLKIQSFLLMGTCLGFYRDGKYIQGDNDLDVGVICSKEKLIELFAKLRENGFRQAELWQNQGWELNQHFWKYGALLDVHFQFLKDVEPFLKKFEKFTYKGVEFDLPSPIEDYLAVEYPPNWRIPCSKRSRPLEGEREKFNGGPPGRATPTDLNKYLEFKGERYEGEK